MVNMDPHTPIRPSFVFPIGFTNQPADAKSLYVFEVHVCEAQEQRLALSYPQVSFEWKIPQATEDLFGRLSSLKSTSLIDSQAIQ